MASDRQVVITGMGVVSPLGTSPATFWERLVAGPPAIGPVTRFDAARFACRLAAEVSDDDLPPVAADLSHEVKRMGRFVRFGIAAAAAALADARMDPGALSARGALFVGVAMGGLPNIEAGVIRQEARGPRATSPYLIPSLIPNMAAGMIALSQGVAGPQYTIAGACASGSQALGQAMRAIQTGQIDCALAGGSEAVITPITFSGFQAMRALSLANDARRAPRPFDRRRDGMVVGEGAALFALEARECAEARGARIYGALSGYGTCSGSASVALPSSADAARCVELALADAGLPPHAIDSVYAHGTGMVKGDECELAALGAVFGARGVRPAITSIKAHTGYSFAANGPLSLAAALLAMRAGSLSPTLNLEDPDEAFASFDFVRAPRAHAIRHCLINTFGFGGINASLIASRC